MTKHKGDQVREYGVTLSGWRAKAALLGIALVLFVPWFVGIVTIVMALVP